MEELEEAITCYLIALILRPPSHPNRSYFLNDLANVLYIRYDQSGRMEAKR
jgi:hypothetical protein